MVARNPRIVMRHATMSAPVSVQKVPIPANENATLGRPGIPRERTECPRRGQNRAKSDSRIFITGEGLHFASQPVTGLELDINSSTDDLHLKITDGALPRSRNL